MPDEKAMTIDEVREWLPELWMRRQHHAWCDMATDVDDPRFAEAQVGLRFCAALAQACKEHARLYALIVDVNGYVGSNIMASADAKTKARWVCAVMEAPDA